MPGRFDSYVETRAGWKRRGRTVREGAQVYALTREASVIINANGVEGIAETHDVSLFHKMDTALLPFLA